MFTDSLSLAVVTVFLGMMHVLVLLIEELKVGWSQFWPPVSSAYS